jgi:hypothetical protein
MAVAKKTKKKRKRWGGKSTAYTTTATGTGFVMQPVSRPKRNKM